ncbi:amino acid adenylation domain-containing protein [Altericista sp. CCNU0014]|uniref:amino acid adenylation domain-containing protein n=1 Tax=Altericista sp. CCNU0014 TaxID=3082949 RepID=UPI00384ECA2C
MSIPLPNITALSPAQQELLRQRLLKQSKPEPQGHIQPQPRHCSAGATQPFPLSFAQERLWFLHQFEPESTAYNIPLAISIQGQLNVAALEQSLNIVIQRHEILRTVFASQDDRPVQVILSELFLPLDVVDLSHLSQSQQQIEVQHLAQQEAKRPFDLETGPLLRTTLLHLKETERVALFTLHHSIADAWSMQVLIQEAIASYTALITGNPATLPDLPIQYADFAVWQRQWLQENYLEAQLAYWKQQLSGTPSLLELPTSRTRPAIQTYRGATQSILFPVSLSQNLKDLARQEGATLFMVLLAAFKVLLYRYTQQEDLWIGTPIANRNRSQLEGLIGFFVNTQVLRTQVTAKESFRAFLSQVKRVALEAYAHQDLPFEQLVETLQPERDPSRNPLFDVMFILQNAPTQALNFPGLSLTPLKVESQTSNFDLTLAVMESEQGLKAQLEYSTDLFHADAIQRMLTHFQTLLAGIIAQPDRSLADLPLLTPVEVQQLLQDWNNTRRDYPQYSCIQQLFELQVEQTPNAIAVVFDRQSLTYQKLNNRANQIAHALMEKGVGPEVRVGLCVERSLELIIGVLGILKAGGAYVPLDPSYPTERLNFILTDAEISILLTQKDSISQLPAHSAQVLLIEAIDSEHQDNPQSCVTPDRLAYTIYTSGSTGQPKGVMVEHQSLINAYFAWEDTYQLKSQATTHLQMANFAFDVFTGDWVRALCAGGKLVLCPREDLLDPKALYTLMQQQQVNCAEFVPAVLRTLMEYLEQTQQNLGFMNLLICGSDRWSVQEYQTFRQYCGPQTRLINSFGLTEATIDSSYFENSDLTLLSDRLVPIGKPFANTQLYILDTHLNPVPIGVKGELYIGGKGLARGYWNRSDLTAERFIPNPFSSDPNARLYRTGDFARSLPDGNIEFLDRLDYQVKIRGVRIELGEIEVAIAQSPFIYQAIVTAHDASSGNARLIAYVVLNERGIECDRHTLSQTLRDYLSQSLTECMIPSAFVILDAIPLTPNGKVDRRALPTPDKAEFGLDRPFTGPQTDLEQAIAAIWQNLLGIEPIGIHDNFFALGGHSLLATRVISKLRQALNVDVPLRCLFESPTIAGLAQHLEQSLNTQTQGDLAAVPIPTIPKRETYSPCPLSFAQDRLYFLTQLEPDSPAYNIPCALRIRGALQIEILKRCFTEIQRRHDILRTRFIPANQQPLQAIEPSAIASLSVIALQNLPPTAQDAEIYRLAEAENLKPFHLDRDPLLRLTVLCLNAEHHVLLFTLHHIISDAWSSGILIQEFSVLYEAFSAGKPSPLTELPIQYADFAMWQRAWLQGEVLENQLHYWSQQLKDAPPVLALPTDRPRPAIQSANGAIETLEFSLELSQALQTLAQQESATLYMVLLAAFKVLLYRYTGQTDILVGSAIANRNRPEIEGLIGFFANTLVLRTQLAVELSFKELLGQVQKVTLDAYEYQDLPFEKLVAELKIERNLSYQPLFQVAFELQNLASQNLQISGLSFEVLEPEVKNAKYDLTLFMSETDRGLVGSCEYNTDLFDRETITCFLGHYQTLLESIIANPEQQISTLPLLLESERQQLLVEWNNTRKEYPSGQTIHQLFEAQVERTPDATSIICGDRSITYHALNTQANQIAHHLISLGVKADRLVGLCFEKSIETIAALLGVLKAGGAYVPIDPTYPEDRVIGILDDSHLQIVLTQEKLTHRFGQAIQTICLNEPAIALQPQNNPPCQSGNQHLSYIIYTSGSTGKPKGVTIEHQSLANFTQSAIENYGIADCDRVLQFASLSFDAAAEEIFPALAQGATLILRTEEMLSTIPTFLNRCLEYQLTVLDLPTAFWHQLVTEMKRLNLALPKSIRLVIIGGEAASAEHLATWQKLAPTVRLINSYGPTETTIVATTWELSPERVLPGNTVPIGKPISNVQTYVLDEALQPVPIGVPGCLYIAGAGLARGYLHQPELTAKAFVRDPFSSDPEARLYRTGDRVRYCRDGNLEFLGRLDEQVKIRGFRIELGEIEAILHQQVGVKAALVIAQEENETQRIVAYIVPDESLDTPSYTQVSQWQTVFDDLYHEFDPQQQSGFYVKGWESSYDHQPIPNEQVQAWMEQTVQRIKQLHPNRVLELGCGGSGLMLLQLAPHCTQYWATDPSANALNILQQQLQKLGKNWSGVTFTQRSADDFIGVQPGSVDTVLIVSVAQYFPNIHYLVHVLEQAVVALEPGGCIFLGDIRNLTLLEAFYTALELERSPNDLPLNTLQHNIQQKLCQEKQLAIDPAFFLALKAHLPQISRVEILLERGLHHNELTQFRYDVILHTDIATVPSIEILWLDWQEAQLSVLAVQILLATQQPEFLGIKNIPNARVSSAMQAIHLLNRATNSATVGSLRQSLQTEPQEGVDPEQLWRIGETLPYTINISWSATSREGQYNALFKRNSAAPAIVNPSGDAFNLQPWHAYANDPQQGLATQQLVGQLRSQLKAKLPSYMMPSAFICLDALPLTPTGKINRQALPLPERSRPELEQTFTAPRSSPEIQMAQLWIEVLGLEQVGIHDNFFELGGHSLLTTQLILKIKETFQVELPLRVLFESPTIANLVENIQNIASPIPLVESKIDLHREAILDADIRPETPFILSQHEPNSILLTGATGFLGGFLLYELLQQTQATVYCLVRSSSLETGHQSIRNCLQSYLIWQNSFEARIIPILGDLALPRLGMTEAEFKILASQIDVIYHNGAWVHHIYPYSVLKPANVLGTKEIIKLACQMKAKPIHFISTPNVFSSNGYTGVRTVLENESIDREKISEDGYVQTKWVAEKLIQTAAQRGLPVSIYRPARISGHSQTGVFNSNDFLYRLIIGCVQMGSVPEGNLNEDIIPIDYASQAIVYLSRQQQSFGQAFHLVNPQLLNVRMLLGILRSCGYPLTQVTYDQWRATLIDLAGQSPEQTLSALLPLFPARTQHQDRPQAELRLDCQSTLAGLAGSGITCPSLDESLLRTYVSYLIQNHALEPS